MEYLVITLLLVLVITLCIFLKNIIHNYIDPNRLVDNKCHFCLTYNKVPYCYHNNWTCNACEQYNGFDKEGNYNIDMDMFINKPNQSPLKSSNSSSQQSAQQTTLCIKCQYNLQMKNNDIQSFNPDSDDYVVFQKYQTERESQFKLCDTCEIIVSSEIGRINRYILSAKYNNQYLPVNSQYSSSPTKYNNKNNNNNNNNSSYSKSKSKWSNISDKTIYTLSIVFSIGNLFKIDQRFKSTNNLFLDLCYALTDEIELVGLVILILMKMILSITESRNIHDSILKKAQRKSIITLESIFYYLLIILKISSILYPDIYTEVYQIKFLNQRAIDTILNIWSRLTTDYMFSFMIYISILFIYRSERSKNQQIIINTSTSSINTENQNTNSSSFINDSRKQNSNKKSITSIRPLNTIENRNEQEKNHGSIILVKDFNNLFKAREEVKMVHRISTLALDDD